MKAIWVNVSLRIRWFTKWSCPNSPEQNLRHSAAHGKAMSPLWMCESCQTAKHKV